MGRTCNGGGFCCEGSKAKYFNQTCVCWPCFFFFGKESVGQQTACMPPNLKVIDRHVRELFSGASHIHGRTV